MSYWKDYGYVDARYDHSKISKDRAWKRIRFTDIRKLVLEAQATNCFATVQRFKDATSLLEQERAAMRDAMRAVKPHANGAANGKAPKQPKGKLAELEKIEREAEGDFLPNCQSRYHGIYFDFDCDYQKEGISLNAAIERSRLDAVKVVTWFREAFGIEEAHIQVWYSGSKGFHVMVRPEPFGIRPHHHLTYIVRNIAFEIADDLKLPTMDRSVYTVRRMWRIPNTLNPKGGRFKIELTVQELTNWTADQIIARAADPRCENGIEDPGADSHIYPEVEYKNILIGEFAAPWYLEQVQTYEAYRDLQRVKPRRPINVIQDADWPVCVKDLMENGPKDGGPGRNRTLLPIANFMLDVGLDKEEAFAQVKEWTETHFGDQLGLGKRTSNGRSVVESVYRGQLGFSCRFIRSVSGSGEKGRVACVGEEKCPWIADPLDQDPAEIPFVPLSEASRGCYSGGQVRTAVHVATMAGRPYLIPTVGVIRCNPDMDAKICHGCPNNAEGGNGELKWTFTAEDREVLNLINVNDSIKKGTIKSKCGIPVKCYRCSFETKEEGNLEEIQLIPMVDYASAYATDDDGGGDGTTKKAAKHVVSLGYHMGHGIEPNKKYIIEPSVFGHPKDQKACFVFDKMEAAQNDIDQFRMTPDLHESLKVFQPRVNQSIEDKLLEIHRDFTANVHHIGGRSSLSIAVDLCYHSVIGFKFVGEEVIKGWFELVIVGETATGKSTIVDRMMKHFGLGEFIAGEDSKRTGLIYASVQLQGQWVLIWGKIPQNDRRLLVIDEFSGIPKEEVGKMTQMRSEGKARGGGVNANYETFARTRLIILSNPRGNNGSMQGHNYGIEAVDQLFEEKADLRRVDLAIALEKGDVSSKLMTKRWDLVDLPHQYTADLCRNLVLWAWSRDPHHVEWGKGAEDEVIKWADRLGDTYDCDLPLAVRADLKLKIARISAAVAARLFSTDKDAKKLIITRDHVEFAANFMDRIYRSPAMCYFEYAHAFKEANYFTAAKKDSIRELFNSYGYERDSIISSLLRIDHITKMVFADMVNLEGDEFKRLWKFLVKGSYLRKTRHAYRKTGAFTAFLKSLGAKGSGYSGDLSDDFEEGGDFDAAVRELTEPIGDDDEASNAAFAARDEDPPTPTRAKPVRTPPPAEEDESTF